MTNPWATLMIYRLTRPKRRIMKGRYNKCWNNHENWGHTAMLKSASVETPVSVFFDLSICSDGSGFRSDWISIIEDCATLVPFGINWCILGCQSSISSSSGNTHRQQHWYQTYKSKLRFPWYCNCINGTWLRMANLASGKWFRSLQIHPLSSIWNWQTQLLCRLMPAVLGSPRF